MQCRECGVQIPPDKDMCPRCQNTYIEIPVKTISAETVDIGPDEPAPIYPGLVMATPKARAMYLLMAVNVLAYLVVAASSGNVMTFDSETLIRFGAQHGHSIYEGDCWRNQVELLRNLHP